MGMAMGRLASLSLWELFGWKQEVQILMLGLGIAGKTTIINILKFGKVVDTIPTVGPTFEKVEYNNISFTFWEFGGQIRFQFWLKHFFRPGQAQGIIFVVDSCNRERIIDARNDLNIILNEEEARDRTLLVFANKQDLPNAMGAEEITEKLGLHCIRNRRWHIQSGSATSGEGVYEAMDWLCNNINSVSVQIGL